MPGLGEQISAAGAVARFLIVDHLEDSGVDQLGQPGAEDIRGDPEPLLELGES